MKPPIKEKNLNTILLLLFYDMMEQVVRQKVECKVSLFTGDALIPKLPLILRPGLFMLTFFWPVSSNSLTLNHSHSDSYSLSLSLSLSLLLSSSEKVSCSFCQILLLLSPKKEKVSFFFLLITVAILGCELVMTIDSVILAFEATLMSVWGHPVSLLSHESLIWIIGANLCILILTALYYVRIIFIFC